MKRYLITGGTGFIGRSLVRALVERGDVVRILDDDSRGSFRLLSDMDKDVQYVNGDIRDFATVEYALTGIDCCVHLAYINGTDAFYTRPHEILDVAVRGISNVIDGCIRNHVPELSVASSSEVYQTPPTFPTDETVPLSVPDVHNPRYSYGGGKIITELMALNFGRKYFDRVTVFRPHNVYGPQMGNAHVIPQLIERIHVLPGNRVHLPIQGTGQETRAFVYISDFTDGLLRVLDSGEHLGIYNIGNPEEITIKILARIIGFWMGKQVKIVPGELQKGGTLRRCPDISKLKALGYSPKVSLDDGLHIVVNDYMACAPETVYA